MRKEVLVTAILIIIFIAQSVAVEANPFMFGPHIRIASPQQFKKSNFQTIYQTASIPIQIQINTPLDYPKIVKVYYILDYNRSLANNPQKALTISSPQTSTYSRVGSILYWATGTLKNLSNGTHKLNVYAIDAEGGNATTGTTNFRVNATSASKNEQSLISNLTIALVISTIAIVIGTSLAVLAYQRRKKVMDRL